MSIRDFMVTFEPMDRRWQDNAIGYCIGDAVMADDLREWLIVGARGRREADDTDFWTYMAIEVLTCAIPNAVAFIVNDKVDWFAQGFIALLAGQEGAIDDDELGPPPHTSLIDEAGPIRRFRLCEVMDEEFDYYSAITLRVESCGGELLLQNRLLLTDPEYEGCVLGLQEAIDDFQCNPGLSCTGCMAVNTGCEAVRH